MLANGVTQSRTWRSDNLPLTNFAPGVVNLTYSWNANKRKTAETNGLFAAQTNNYTGYDDEDRLTGWQRGNGDTQTWSLSTVGDWNSTTVNGVQEDRTHNAVHEILTATPPNPAAQLVHDAKGNLSHNKNGHDYVWDIENQLVQVIVEADEPGIAGMHSYSYNALGRRVSKTVNDVTTVFVNNANWQEVAEYQSGALVQNYIFGDYIDEVLAIVKAEGTLYFYSTNDLYSTYALTDGTGNVTERFMYDSYGKVTVLEPNGETVRNVSLYGNPWTFNGRRLDSETGLMYYRNRMYSANLGRFVSRDPIGYADGASLYSAYYVPNGLDPLGLLRVSVSMSIRYNLTPNLPQPTATGTILATGAPTFMNLRGGGGSECIIEEGDCHPGCKRAKRVSAHIQIQETISLPRDVPFTYNDLRHEIHHGVQMRADIERRLREIPDNPTPPFPCVHSDAAANDQKIRCENELRNLVNAAYDGAHSDWMASMNPPGGYVYAEDPYERDGGPHGNHPAGGAFDHANDRWPTGFPLPPSNFPQPPPPPNTFALPPKIK
jgi:RHS repeat-associated protein